MAFMPVVVATRGGEREKGGGRETERKKERDEARGGKTQFGRSGSISYINM
jgi:hypothetical protein